MNSTWNVSKRDSGVMANTERSSTENVTCISMVSGTFANSGETPWSRVVVGLSMTPIIVLGSVGNILSLLVWMKIRRCKNSTACFLAALTVADLFALLTAGLNFWLTEVMFTDVRITGRFACKFIIYMDFVCQFVSAWIITLVTAERAVSLWFPYKY